MKKVLLVSILLVLSLSNYAQKTDSLKNSIQKNAEVIGQGGNNELKINLLYTVLGIAELSYERLLEDNMGVGASIQIGVDNSSGTRFAFIPYYRIYFGAKKASGFFIEGNTGIVATRDYNYYDFIVYPPEYPPVNRVKNKTSLGFGAAAGAKFLTRNGFIGEAYLGAGRLFGNRDNHSSHGAYARVGITIGKRF